MKRFVSFLTTAILVMSFGIVQLIGDPGDSSGVKPLRPPTFPSDVPHNQPKRATVNSQDVNVSFLAGNEAEVSIDINPTDPNNLVIVGHAPDGSTMNTFYTTNGGDSWSLVPLGQADDGFIGCCGETRFDPTLAFDDDGNLYVGYGVWWDTPDTIAYVSVIVCRSNDGGASYWRCDTLASDPWPDCPPLYKAMSHDKWHLATGPDPTSSNQAVYMAWTKIADEGGGCAWQVDYQVVVSRGYPDSVFSEPVVINDHAIAGVDTGWGADPAVGPNGEVYVSWYDYDDAWIRCDASFDRGITWGTDVDITPLIIREFRQPITPQPWRGVTPGPTIDTDRTGGTHDGRIYITYMDLTVAGSSDGNIFVRYSDDWAATWSLPVMINDDGGVNSQFLPWLDVDQRSGMVSVVWYDARFDVNNEKVHTFLGTSTDGAISWGNYRLADMPSDQSSSNPDASYNNYLEYIGVTSYQGASFAAWADNSMDPADLDFYFDRFASPLVDCGVCNLPSTPQGEPILEVRADWTFTNTCGTSANDLEFSMANLFGSDVFGARVAAGAPFTAGACIVVTNAEVVVELAGGTVPDGGKVHAELTLCQALTNDIVVTNAYWTLNDNPLCDIPPSGFAVDFPRELYSDVFGHDIAVLNLSPIPLQVRNLEAVADTELVVDLEDVSFTGPHHVVLIGSTPETILPGDTLQDTFETDGSFDGGHVYIRYEISNVTSPSGPGDWDQIIADHPVVYVPPTPVDPAVAPLAHALHQNVPNPFNPTTMIEYQVAGGPIHVRIDVYDVAGRHIKTLVDAHQTAGIQRAVWDGRNSAGQRVSTGVYFYRMRAGRFEQTRKMLLLQ
jgi:hypothetical protein